MDIVGVGAAERRARLAADRRFELNVERNTDSSRGRRGEPLRRPTALALPIAGRSLLRHLPGRTPWRWALLVLALTALLLPLTAEAQQEMDPVLVSNIGQTAGDDLATTETYPVYAQSFRTGTHPDGYYLTSVDLGLAAASGVTAKVELWWGKSSGDGGLFHEVFGEDLDEFDPRFGYFYIPATRLAELSAVDSIDTNAATAETFSVHDVLLQPDAVYWIVVTRTAGDSGGLSLATTNAGDAIDGGGMDGFSVMPNVFARNPADLKHGQHGWVALSASGEDSLKIRLRGSKATNRPPGPYGTNRNQQARAAPVETSSTVSKLATSFHSSATRRVSDFTNPSTYQLTSVLLSVAAESGTVPRVAIHADSSGSPAATPLAGGTLTTPSGIATDLARPGRAEFTVSPALTLTANTTYWVVLDAGSGTGKLSVSTTATDNQDGVSAFLNPKRTSTGWSIGDTMKTRGGPTWSDDAGGRSFRMALNGATDPHSGVIVLGLAQIGVGHRPYIEDWSDGDRIRNESWQWKRGDSRDGTFADIPAGEGGTARHYVPSEGTWVNG